MAHHHPVLLVALLALALPALSSATQLAAFKSCTALRSYMISNAVKRVGPWGLRTSGLCFYGGGARRGNFALAEADNSPVALSSAPSGDTVVNLVEGVDFSGTNVQVSGVDEPDIVKTDGQRVLALSGDMFSYVLVSKDGSSGYRVTNFTIPTYPRDMLFDPKTDSVVVISQTYEYVQPLPVSRGSRRLFYPFGQSRPIIALYRISLKDRGNVRITDTAYVQGRYISARSVDGVARLVLSYDGSQFIRFAQPGGKVTQQDATKLNIDIAKKTKLSDWVPTYNATGKYCPTPSRCLSYTYKRPLIECASTFFPSGEFSGFSLLTVATFRLAGPLRMSGTGIIADGDTVYATATSLYAATTEYQYDVDEFDNSIGTSFTTSFHKFALSSNMASYVGSGAVTGSVLNQFSMHEYDGTFFVATTDGAPWWGSRDTSVSKVSAFRVVGGKTKSLKKTGEVGGLGKGERIYAVRYIAQTAYIVTFRQVDPLYIVDLSNVYKLRVTGELKIPGYSAYLHPISPGRILGVGRDATEEGITTGAKVSLFDVSDTTKPKELSSWTLKGSYSSAEWEHKAFLWWGPEKMAVLPLSVYNRDSKEQFRGAIALNVDDGSITERGRVTHSCCGYKWRRAILRTFVIRREKLWSLSYNAFQVNDIDSLKKKSVIRLGDQ